MNLTGLASSRSRLGQFLPGTHWRPHTCFRERAYLEREYVLLGRSTGEVAKEHGVTDAAIIFWLKKHGIARRTVSQARAVKKWGLSGAANPMFGRRGHLNHRYVDGSSPERQELYSRSEWKQLVASVYKRDGYRCRRCSHPHRSDRILVAHHVKPWAGNPSLRRDTNNLVTLCQKCHHWVHSRANTEREWLA